VLQLAREVSVRRVSDAAVYLHTSLESRAASLSLAFVLEVDLRHMIARAKVARLSEAACDGF
jgi:hypothetical protein